MSNWKLVQAEATTNLLTNPSFEKNTTGWSAGTNWTAARSTAQAKFGAASLLLTSSASASTQLGRYDNITLPTTSTTYTISGWVRVSSGWDGGNIQLSVQNMSGASVTANHLYTDGTSSTDTWVYMESELTVASDVSGNITVVTSSAPGASKTVYVDAIQVEEKTYATTYCDGDQPGCAWRAEPHASISRRRATAWQGGRVRDFVDDLDVNVVWQNGAGTAETDLNVTEYALVSGGSYDFSRQRSRTWQMLIAVNEDSLANYHATRRDFWELINPKRFGGNDPVLLRYDGGSETLEAACVYAAGMEGGGKAGYYEDFPIRWVNPDPFWYEIGNAAKALTTVNDVTLYGGAGFYNNTWNVWPDDGLGALYTINRIGNKILVGGLNVNIAGIAAADYIAAFDVSSEEWEGLDSGTNNAVYALHPYNDTVFVGGLFTTVGAGASTANGLAQWTGSAWDTTYSPSSIAAGRRIQAITVDKNGYVYVGGTFTELDSDTNIDYLARTTDGGASWSIVGTTAPNDEVRALAVDKAGNVWAGGDFTSIDGVTCSGVAYWDGSSWNRPGTDALADVYAIEVHPTVNYVYIGGTFTGKVKWWNGTKWQTPKDVPNNTVRALYHTGAELIMGGDFTAVGNLAVGYVAAWDGITTRPLGLGLDNPVYAALEYSDDIYLTGTMAAGEFPGTTTVTNNGTTPARPVLRIKRSGGTSARLAYISNETTGKRLTFNYDMVDGETVTIDLRPGEYSMTSSQFGENWRILSSSDVTGFTLGAGDNLIKAYVEEDGSPTIEATLHWRVPYGGYDA